MSSAAAVQAPERVRSRRPASPGAAARTALWAFRALLLVPFVLMAPVVLAALAGRPDGLANISATNADVLGNAIFIVFALMLGVTPLATLTGWRWHVVLRRDYGVGMFALALLDLVLAAIATGDTFSGGVMTRVVGRSFLFFGTLSTVLCLPLALTANRFSQRRLGRHWKPIQRLTYVVWVTILLHLLLLFGLRGLFLDAVEVSVPLAVLRVAPLRRWLSEGHKAHTHRLTRVLVGALAVGVFVHGLYPFVADFAASGRGAFAQRPVVD